MLITLDLSAADFRSALNELLPTQIWLDDERKRWISISAPDVVEVIEREGIRLACSGELRWTIANVPTTLNIDKLRIMVKPSIDAAHSTGNTLAFRFVIEQMQLPTAIGAMLDSAVVKTVNAAMNDRAFGWKFSDTLTRNIELPAIFSNVSGVRLATGPASLTVEHALIRIVLTLDVGFTRAAP